MDNDLERAIQSAGEYCLKDVEMSAALRERILKTCLEADSSFAKKQKSSKKEKTGPQKLLPWMGLAAAAVIVVALVGTMNLPFGGMKSEEYTLEAASHDATIADAQPSISQKDNIMQDRAAGAETEEKAEAEAFSAPAEKETLQEEIGSTEDLASFAPPGMEIVHQKHEKYGSTGQKYVFSSETEKLTVFEETDDKIGQGLMLQGNTEQIDLDGIEAKLLAMDGGATMSWQQNGVYYNLSFSSAEKDRTEHLKSIALALRNYIELM